MVAFKEEFPYLRTDSGQLFEFNRDWLHAAITRAADEAGYPSWWLTDHVTESIAFYLRLRNDENVVAFSQLSQTVRYVLKVIGYKEIVHELETGGREVLSSVIGAKVLEKLRALDEVAYLRYASVYQRFQDVDQFVDAIHTLGRRIKPNALQRELFPPETTPGGSASVPARSRDIAINKNHGRV